MNGKSSNATRLQESSATAAGLQTLTLTEMEQFQGGDCTHWDPKSIYPGCQVDETYLYYGYYKGTTVRP